jgi:hypothetical protein
MNACIYTPKAVADDPLIKPITGILDCCPLAAIGHAAEERYELAAPHCCPRGSG